MGTVGVVRKAEMVGPWCVSAGFLILLGGSDGRPETDGFGPSLALWAVGFSLREALSRRPR